MNIRNLDGYKHSLKPFMRPFRKQDDERFFWLENMFLSYFSDWQSSIQRQVGDQFDETARNKMFISRQTYHGILITTKSIIECFKFLLSSGAD